MNGKYPSIRENTLKEWLGNPGIAGIIALSNQGGWSVLAEGSDLLLVLVFEQEVIEPSIFHYSREGLRIQERRIARQDITKWMNTQDGRAFLHWIMQGEIWLDHGDHLHALRGTLQNSPIVDQEQKLLVELSLFFKRYMQSKDYLQGGFDLDAYSSILRAIHHWARIIVIEEGVYPELALWSQIKSLNFGIYKLYEELTTSPETLRQRIELVLLACEFSVMSKLESCCKPLLRIVSDHGSPMSIAELCAHPLLADCGSANLSLLLHKLVRKQLLKEVAIPLDEEMTSLEIRYTRM